MEHYIAFLPVDAIVEILECDRNSVIRLSVVMEIRDHVVYGTETIGCVSVVVVAEDEILDVAVYVEYTVTGISYRIEVYFGCTSSE